MPTRQFPIAIAIVAALAAPGASRAEATPSRASCFLDDSRVLSVLPYYEEPSLGRAGLRSLRGAEVQLAPVSRVTTEYLEEVLQRLLGAPNSAPLPACLLDVGRVHIESTPLGEAASVTLIARDPKDAEQVFLRTRRILDE